MTTRLKYVIVWSLQKKSKPKQAAKQNAFLNPKRSIESILDMNCRNFEKQIL